MPGRGRGGLGLHLDTQTGRTRLQAPKTREPESNTLQPLCTQQKRELHPMPHGQAATTMTVESKPCRPRRESTIKTGPGPARPPARPWGPGLLEIEQGHSCYSGDTGFPWIKQAPIKMQPTKFQKPFIHPPERETRKMRIHNKTSPHKKRETRKSQLKLLEIKYTIINILNIFTAEI